MNLTYVGIIFALWLFDAALLFGKGALWLLYFASILILLTSLREFQRMLRHLFVTQKETDFMLPRSSSVSKILLLVLLLSVAGSFFLVFRLTGLSLFQLFS